MTMHLYLPMNPTPLLWLRWVSCSFAFSVVWPVQIMWFSLIVLITPNSQILLTSFFQKSHDSAKISLSMNGVMYNEGKTNFWMLSFHGQSAPVGTTVYSGISATDLDTGTNKKIDYAIVPGDGSIVSVHHLIISIVIDNIFLNLID